MDPEAMDQGHTGQEAMAPADMAPADMVLADMVPADMVLGPAVRCRQDRVARATSSDQPTRGLIARAL